MLSESKIVTLHLITEWLDISTLKHPGHQCCIWHGGTKCTSCRRQRTYSTIVSRSAMSPRTMRCIMLLCSSSDRFLYDTRGMLYFVAGEGSTPWSHAWFSISSKDALRFGSLCNIRVIRLQTKNRSKQNALACLKDNHSNSSTGKNFAVSSNRSSEVSM